MADRDDSAANWANGWAYRAPHYVNADLPPYEYQRLLNSYGYSPNPSNIQNRPMNFGAVAQPVQHDSTAATREITPRPPRSIRDIAATQRHQRQSLPFDSRQILAASAPAPSENTTNAETSPQLEDTRDDATDDAFGCDNSRDGESSRESSPLSTPRKQEEEDEEEKPREENEEEEPRIDTSSNSDEACAAESFYVSAGNDIRALFAMGIGLTNANGSSFLSFTDPAFKAAKVSTIKPSNNLLANEQRRRRSEKKQTPNFNTQATRKLLMEYLEENPIDRVSDISFVKKEISALAAKAVAVEKGRNNSGAGPKWSGPTPWLRLLHCVTDVPENKAAFMHHCRARWASQPRDRETESLGDDCRDFQQPGLQL